MAGAIWDINGLEGIFFYIFAFDNMAKINNRGLNIGKCGRDYKKLTKVVECFVGLN